MSKSHPRGKVFNAIVIVLAITTILVSSTLATSILPTSENAFAYKENQATSQAGDCGNGQVPENVGCQNIGSSIQGDENVVNIIGQQQFPAPASTVEPPPPADIATLVIKKKVECVAGAQCANLPAVEDFSMFVQPSNGPDPEPVDGSAAGESVTFSPGEYNTIEKIPEDPDGLVFFESTKSIDCDSNMKGPILAGEVRECTFTNKYEPEPGTLTVVKNVECADPNGRECPDLPNPSEFTLLVSDSDGDTISFPGSAEGTPVNLALDGPYQVTEPEEVPIPDTLDFLGVTFSSECSGSLRPGEHRNCVVTNSYAPDEPPVVVVPATLTVVKNVECAAGQQCPNLGVPSDWNMFVIHGDNKIITIPGSTAGTLVSIEPGNYEVLEGGPVPDGLGFDFTRSSTCFSSTSSPIRAGEERTCTYANIFRPL
jgi:hypothetical protein